MLQVSETINPCAIPNSLEDFGMFLYRNPPELRLLCVPEPSRTSSAICPATLRNLISFLHRNPPELHQLSAPEPSRTLSAICTRTFGTLSAICAETIRNLISFSHLHRNPPEPNQLSARNPPEPHQLSAPEPSRTVSAIDTGTIRICTGAVRNLVCYLRRNHPEPHQPSAPHPNPPQPSGTFSGTWGCSCTGSHQSYSGLKTP